MTTLSDLVLASPDGAFFPDPLPDEIPVPLGNCRECNTPYNYNPWAGEVYCPQCIPGFGDVLVYGMPIIDFPNCPECGESPAPAWEHVKLVPHVHDGKKAWQVRRWEMRAARAPAMAHHLWFEHDYRFKDGPLAGNRDFTQPYPWRIVECPVDATKLEMGIDGVIRCPNHGAIVVNNLVRAVIHDWHGAIPGTLASEWWMNRKKKKGDDIFE
jgi:hypothetical protein